MKRIVCLLLCVMVLCCGFSVNAEEYISVNLEIQLGSYIAYVDGEAVSCEAPFLKDGHTLAPIEVLSKAFGKEYSDKIKYNGITVKFEQDSNVALVDEEKQEIMPLRAEIVNGSLMVPVRFVCDTFNALIEYEESTGTIRVTKSADFSDIFGKSMNGYWCDENYGWMIQIPTDFDLSKNVYDGSHNQFMNTNGNAAFNLYINKNIFADISQIRARFLATNAGEVIRKEEYVTLNGDVKAYFAMTEDYMELLAINDSYLYEFEFFSTNAANFSLYAEEAEMGLKSLSFEIDSGKNPENVSILNEGGYVVEGNDNLGFTVNKIKSWTEIEHDGTNVVSWSSQNFNLISNLFGDEYFGGTMKVSVFSKEKEDTVKQLIEKERKYVEDRYKAECLKNVYVHEVTSKDVLNSKQDIRGMQIDYDVVFSGRYQVNKTKFYIHKDYIYKMEYYIQYSEKTDLERIPDEEVERMFDSIKIKGVNSSKVGTVVNTSARLDNSLMQTYSNDYGEFSIDLPAAWVSIRTSDAIAGGNSQKNINVSVERERFVSSLESAKTMITGIYPTAKFTATKYYGKKAYKVEMSQEDDSGDNVNFYGYLFVADGNAYCIAASIKEVYESDANMAMIDRIFKSFKLL